MGLTAREKRAARRATYFGSSYWGVVKGRRVFL